MPKSITTVSIITFLAVMLQFSQEPLFSQESDASTEKLAPFSRLIGGKWYLANTYQVFEWGVGNKAVRARSYIIDEGTAKPVSEGNWFWHPGEQKIKGFMVALDMPAVLFEYDTQFSGDSMINELVTYDADGAKTVYREIWEFTSEDSFFWTLYSLTGGQQTKLMEGMFERKD